MLFYSVASFSFLFSHHSSMRMQRSLTRTANMLQCVYVCTSRGREKMFHPIFFHDVYSFRSYIFLSPRALQPRGEHAPLILFVLRRPSRNVSFQLFCNSFIRDAVDFFQLCAREFNAHSFSIYFNHRQASRPVPKRKFQPILFQFKKK